jgi:hypothetical protein
VRWSVKQQKKKAKLLIEPIDLHPACETLRAGKAPEKNEALLKKMPWHAKAKKSW